MKRFAGMMILTAWLAAVTWYWRENVPLAASSWARMPPGTQARNLTPSGQLTLVHSRFTDGPGGPVILCGPLEFWGFPECRKVRQLFDQNDQIIHGPLSRTREVLIRRNGRLVVIDSESGATIGDLPDVPGATGFKLLPGENRVLIQDKLDVHLYEFGQNNPLWTAPSLSLRGPLMGEAVVDGLVTVTKMAQRGPDITGTGGGILQLGTGKLDPRFDHLGKFSRVRFAPNGRFAVVWVSGSLATMTPGKIVVCDAVTGALLWTMPPVDSSNGPIFDDGGDEIRALEMTPQRRLEPGRWRSLDGSRLPSLHPPDFAHFRAQSFDGQFVLRFRQMEGRSILARAVNHINSFAARYWPRFYIKSQPQIPELVDSKTGRTVGLLPENSAYLFLPDRPALVCAGFTDIHYYELPPPRDYSWLARWAMLPPLSVMAGSIGWNALRRRRAQPPPIG